MAKLELALTKFEAIEHQTDDRSNVRELLQVQIKDLQASIDKVMANGKAVLDQLVVVQGKSRVEVCEDLSLDANWSSS